MANAYNGRPVTIPELKAFFAMLIIMDAISLPSVHFYWTLKWPFGLPSYSFIISRNRFELIFKFLHFSDNDHHIPRDQPGHDHFCKICPFLSTIIKNFQKVDVPHQNLFIGEIMIGFKGRLSFLQYMPKKPQKWGEPKGIQQISNKKVFIQERGN